MVQSVGAFHGKHVSVLTWNGWGLVGWGLLVGATGACGGRVSALGERSGHGGSQNSAGAGGSVTESGGRVSESGGSVTESNGGAAGVPNRLEPEFVFPVPQGAVPLSAWTEKSAESMCAFLANTGDKISRGNYRGEPCVSYFTNFYREMLDLETLVAEGKVSYDPDAFGECLTQFARSVYSPVDSIPCVLTIGALPEGANCEASLVCDKTLTCGFDPTVQADTCQKPLVVGGDCSARDCPRGLYCREGSCLAQHRVNTDCELYGEWRECITGSFCADVGIEDYTGSCRSLGVSTSSRCENGYTYQVTDTELDENDNVVDVYSCVAVSLPGESCLTTFDDACTYDYYCNVKVCQLRAEIGESCEPSVFNVCVYGARCNETRRRCVNATRAKFGEACATDDDCYSQSCRLSRCEKHTLFNANDWLREGTPLQ